MLFKKQKNAYLYINFYMCVYNVPLDLYMNVSCIYQLYTFVHKCLVFICVNLYMDVFDM